MFHHYTPAGSVSPDWLRLCRALESEPAAAPVPASAPQPASAPLPEAA